MPNSSYRFVQSNPRQLADRLSNLLKFHQLNSNQLAQALGIPLMTIRRLISGETADPRISTLKLIADYFNISIDSLLDEKNTAGIHSFEKNRSHFVPILDWNAAEKMENMDDLYLHNWEKWQFIPLNEQNNIGKNTFALQSRPSMHPRFPQGTIFILDPDLEPMDGDIVLIKIKENNQLTLRHLIIDPPEWQLHSIVQSSNKLNYNNSDYKMIAVNLLTMLYNRRD